MSNHRIAHKARLKALLEAVTFEGANLSVSDTYENNGAADPYLFIVSGGLTPNKTSESLYDWSTYQRIYEYQIVCAFSYTEPSKEQEDRIDELEALIVDLIQSRNFRNDATAWQDVILSNVSEPFNPDPQTRDNLIYKVFTIQVETLTTID